MNPVQFCLIALALLCLSSAYFKIRVLYQGSNGLLVVFGKDSFYVCRYTVDDFLGPWSTHILDRWGQIFLADENEICRLKKRELHACLSEDELREIEQRLGLYGKICVIRNHKLADRARERLAWWAEMRGNWPRFPKSPDRRKDDIIVSPV